MDTPGRELPPSHAGDWLRAEPAARSRLEARLRRAAVVAKVTGGVGLSLILLVLFATDLLRNLFLSTHWRGAVALAVNVLMAVAAALCAWVLFYALRLANRSGRRTPGDAGGNLRKLRAGTCMLLVTSLAVFTIGTSSDGSIGDLALAVPGCLASAACCYFLVSLRRLAWDVALAEGAAIVRPGGARGFAVLSAYAPPPESATMPAAVAPALPTAQRAAADAAPWEKGSAFREWETLLTVLAVFAMAVYVFRTPAAIAFIAAIVDSPRALADLMSALLGSRTASGLEQAQSWIVLTSFGLSLCAAAWVVWGVLCLTAGPRLRVAAITLAAVTLGLVAVVLCVHVYFMTRYSGGSDYMFRRRYEERLIDPLSTGSSAERVALECVLPVVLLFVLTRRPVKELFCQKLRRPRP